MTPAERDATAALCLFAALADGRINPQEQAKVQTAIQSLMGGQESPGSDVYQRVLLGQTDVPAEAAKLSTPELRRQAYELAAAVCAVDGATSNAEQAFLTALASALGVSDQHAESTLGQANQIATAAVEPQQAGSRDTEIAEMIKSTAILTGALELLPHSLASMAIIPLQMRMVYRIGTKYGYSLDRASIGEFLGVLGFGATSQMIESVASKLVSGLFGGIGGAVVGRTLGGVVGSITGVAGGAAVSFASTYALGQVAQQYYAGGRSLGAIDLRSVYSTNLAAAKNLFSRYAPQVQSQARNLDPSQLLNLAKGGLGL